MGSTGVFFPFYSGPLGGNLGIGLVPKCSNYLGKVSEALLVAQEVAGKIAEVPWASKGFLLLNLCIALTTAPWFLKGDDIKGFQICSWFFNVLQILSMFLNVLNVFSILSHTLPIFPIFSFFSIL